MMAVIGDEVEDDHATSHHGDRADADEDFGAGRQPLGGVRGGGGGADVVLGELEGVGEERGLRCCSWRHHDEPP